MRFQIFLIAGLIALASASPLVDKKQSSSLRVIDIPADLIPEAAEEAEDVKKPIEHTDVSVASSGSPKEDVTAPKDIIEEKKEDDIANADTKTKDKTEGADDTEEIDRPAIFGFRLPTIVILRRPAVFDDPFSFFPFSSINRRPTFASAPSVPTDDRLDEDRPTFAAAASSEQRPVSFGAGPGIGDVMHNMRQQMDSLFSSLFAPNPGYFPNRQFFPRPFFPPTPSDSSEDSKELLDFDNLPANYKNTTSETKVVDGQVIQVNKTVHKISGNNSNGFFQFSVIKIRPSDGLVPEEKKPEEAANNIPPAAIATSEEKKSETEATTIKAQQESEMSNPSLNEVDQDEKMDMMTNTKYETDPDAGLIEEPMAPITLPLTQEVVYDFVPVKSLPMPLIDATKGIDNDKSKPHDLSSDLRVNNLMANDENGRLRSLVDPDEIEMIEV